MFTVAKLSPALEIVANTMSPDVATSVAKNKKLAGVVSSLNAAGSETDNAAAKVKPFMRCPMFSESEIVRPARGDSLAEKRSESTLQR